MTTTLPPSSLLPRPDALRECAYLNTTHIRILSVHGKGGSGKTVLVSQYEANSNNPFVWIGCNHLHADPRVLIEDIVKSLVGAFSGMRADKILRPLMQPLAPEELLEVAALRVKTCIESINAPLTLVIDDAHLLQEHVPSLELIRRIFDSAPDTLRMIIISRFPVTIDNEPLFPTKRQVVIDDSILALTREETATLYNDIFGIPVGSRQINELHRKTQGWLAGLVLLRNSTAPGNGQPPSADLDVGKYFDELIQPLKEDVRREILLLAPLKTMPAALLDEICSPALVEWVRQMASKNLFIRSDISHGETHFRLHHLFQAHLQDKAVTTLSAEERDAFLRECGTRLLLSREPETALTYLASAKAWTELTAALKVHGLAMVANNRHKTLQAILDSMPDSVRDADAWTNLIHGLVLLNANPADSHDHLQKANRLFRASNDQIGELVALASFNICNLTVFGNFRRNACMLDRIILLFKAHRDYLPKELLEQVAQSISLGFVYIFSDTRKAKQYLAQSASGGGTPEQVVFNPHGLYLKTLLLGLEGNIQTALKEIAPFFPLSNDPVVSSTTRYSLDIIQANYLAMAGNLTGYKELRRYLPIKWGKQHDNFFISVFLTIWDLDVMVAEGEYEKAFNLADSYDNAHGDSPAHTRSQILHYQMIAAAHLGRKGQALSLLRQALRLRSIIGGPYFRLLTHSLAGGTLFLLGETKQARRVLDCCLKRYRALNLRHGQLAFAYRASIHLAAGREAEAEHDIAAMLDEMRQPDNEHFFGWSPDILRPLLCLAVKKNIHKTFARKLAKNRLAVDILDNGTPIPLLKIQCVTNLRLSTADKALSESDLSPMWQKLIRSLAEFPTHALDIESIQEALWPDSPPEKTRSKFDTMLSRLRNKIGALVGEDNKRHYFQLHGQKLYLQHCLVDLDHILAHAENGIKYAELQQHWQAHNAFILMRHWLDSAYKRSSGWAVAQKHKRVVVHALMTWATLLARSNAPEKALEAIEACLRFEPVNDTAHRQRYDLLALLKRPGEAHKSIREYRKVLVGEGFDEPEVDQIIENIFDR